MLVPFKDALLVMEHVEILISDVRALSHYFPKFYFGIFKLSDSLPLRSWLKSKSLAHHV